MTFKKGQKVKIVGNTAISHYAYIGGFGTVFSEYDGPYDAYIIKCRTTTGQTMQVVSVVDLDICNGARVV